MDTAVVFSKLYGLSARIYGHSFETAALRYILDPVEILPRLQTCEFPTPKPLYELYKLHAISMRLLLSFVKSSKNVE